LRVCAIDHGEQKGQHFGGGLQGDGRVMVVVVMAIDLIIRLYF